MDSSIEIFFQPMLAPLLIWAIAIISVCGLFYMGYAGQRLPLFRALFMIVLILLLINPSFKKITGSPTDTVVNVLTDRSHSQKLSGRMEETDRIDRHVIEQLSSLENTVVNHIEISPEEGGVQTRFTPQLKDRMANHNQKRIGGSLLITDGQLSDAAKEIEALEKYGPVHVMLTGNPKEEFDRTVKIVSAPEYVVVGESLPVRIRVDDFPAPLGEVLDVSIFLNQEQVKIERIETGKDTLINIPVNAPGEMIVRFEVVADNSELSAVNNTAVLRIQGVRARLKVLLVSGQPHQGLRIWRNLLKSDPSVDLVHFTILRSFDSIDITPPDQMALIPFPTEELFEERIKDFDLIIFDRYTRRNILLPQYFDNIVSFVQEGGGLLFVHGPEESVGLALSDTSLGAIMPYSRIENDLNQNGAMPFLAPFGARHPITSPLAGDSDNWGTWMRYLNMQKVSESSQILLQEKQTAAPLLVIDQVGKGRVAQFMTEQIWLWARGYDGGGPYNSLMKRLSHWLMKEPTLDYSPLKMTSVNGGIDVTFQENALTDQALFITTPEKQTFEFNFDDKPDAQSYFYETDTSGYYRAEYGPYSTHIILSDPNSPEYQRLVTSEDIGARIAGQTGGTVVALSDAFDVSFELTDRNRYQNGNSLYFKRSTDLQNRRIKTWPLLPWWLAAFIGFAFLTVGWLRQE